jgi:hypothetical protein
MAEKQRLGDLLLESNLITTTELDKALRLQVGGNRRLGYLLVKMGFISEEQLHSILTRQLDLPLADIDKEFDPEVKHILPRYLCLKYSVIPLKIDADNTLRAAMVDPSDIEAVSDIEHYTGKVIRPELASTSVISAGIRKNIPWSFKDVFNAQTFTKFTALVATLALLLVIVTAFQFYQERKEEKYGKVTSSPGITSYENLELILGFDDKNNVTLLGRGAHSPGYYSVTFGKPQDLKDFIESKKDGFSATQLEWLDWAITNPRGS